MSLVKVNESVTHIFSLIEQYGFLKYPGTAVNLLEHALQTAVHAGKETKDEELLLAAFFHDIGHICDLKQEPVEIPVTDDHEIRGAHFLEHYGFSERIVALVQHHVLAKRYLTYKHPDYYLSLTDAGKESLEYQGGPLCMDEASRFEANPMFHELVQLRKWDEMSKQPIISLPRLYEYRYMTMYHLICRANHCMV
jgi:2-amino-1-hydroxyethylphosphonate dioxygenase (glycine-forming)